MDIKFEKPIKFYDGQDLWGYQDDDKMIFIPEMVKKHYYSRELFDYDDDFTTTIDRFWNRFIKKRIGDDNIDRFKVLTEFGFNPKRFNLLEVLKKTNAKMIQDDFWIDFGEGEYKKKYKMNNINRITTGVLQKWVIDDYLYKDSAYLYSKEPYSETICSDILDYLNLNHVKYEVVNSLYVNIDSMSINLSRCKIDKRIVKISDVLQEENDELLLDKILNIDDKIGLLNMFIFDALVSNPDRHINNIHLKNNKIIILDNGQALSSMNDFEILINHWKSQPYGAIHDKQLKFLFSKFKSILNFTIINNLSSINEKIISPILNKYIETGSKRQNILELIINNKNNILKIYEDIQNSTLSWV